MSDLDLRLSTFDYEDKHMAQQTPQLAALKRDRLGSRYARRLRRDGRLPAVVYGHGQEPLHVTIDNHDFVHHLHEGVHLLQLQTDGQIETCLIKDVQYDHLGSQIIHVDLARIDLNEEVTVSVPLELRGKDKSPGAKAPNSIVEQPIVDLEVRCLASNIPDEIIVDISMMNLGDVLTVADLKLPEGVATDEDPEAIVVSIQETREVVEEAVAPEAAAGEPEVITERKPKEGEAATAPEAAKKEPKKEGKKE
jgi:large subunit ribosomal protein L25